MPAKIVITAELQTLLAKSQATTEANRRAQREREAEKEKDRKALKAKKEKEEAAKKKKALEDSVLGTRRTAAMSQRQLGGIAFALIPSAAFNSSITGPFGEFQDPEWTAEWGGHGGVTGLARGYSNTLWGLQERYDRRNESAYPPPGLPVSDFADCVLSAGTKEFNLLPVFGGGGYQTQSRSFRADFCGSQPGLYADETIGGFVVGHVVASGNNRRFRFDGDFLPLVGEELEISRTAPSASTLEVIVRLGAGASTATTGTCDFNIAMAAGLGFNLSLAEGSFSFGGSSIPGIDGSIGGTDIHCAVVTTAAQQRIYFNGLLLSSETFDEDNPNPFLAYTGPLFVNADLRDSGITPYAEINTGSGLAWELLADGVRDYNGPSVLKGIRYTERALYAGDSFTPPTSFSGLA